MAQLCVVDFTGAEIKLAQTAKRIVCLTAAGLDILLELDMEPVGYLTKGVADKPEFYGERAKQFKPVGSWIFPNWKAVRKLNPDLILGWSFPHRFYRKLFGNTAPLYLMGGTGYKAALQRLRDVAQLTGRVSQAEAAIARFENRLENYRTAVPTQEYKTVLFMGGSSLNHLSRKFIIETNIGTFGSIVGQFAHYPWVEPEKHNNEPGLTNISLQQILEVDPDIIFVQTYAPSKTSLSKQLSSNRTWQQIKAVQTQKVYEIDQLWHSGNGTRVMGLTLDKIMPFIYPGFITPYNNPVGAD
ncbi:iron abc transporter substrate-binding protein [Leptolyngbya sp. Heron Island J]|uniref:ABC transporter substrate-binding protein n=1 Tax=Leptolyngbya sp. Heron Island J TaxID=1385935 RepID=UPI0003B9B3A2|nr:ABC transporter substrate-binding protein [Leptolyngbya sp. Heron Island J]ESA37658.1 iron abc transporter substrate-binding protein [Leptolyngbya sp. Heron Island J]